MSSSAQSDGTTKPDDVFQELWRQLAECHQNALQDLEAKVSKLKKDRCLDAQRLEVFYNHNQQLKEQNKALQDAISLLEERLRAGECDRCPILEENLKNSQDQNLHIIAQLKSERNILEDENRKLHAELQKLKMACSEASSSEQEEEGIIPDSPILPSSVPQANKLRKRKNGDKMKHVRYAETPLPRSNNSLFNELVATMKNPGRAEILVPNTCELDASQMSKDVKDDGEEAVAETCVLELHDKRHMKEERAASHQSSSNTPSKLDALLKFNGSSRSFPPIHSPDSATGRSPSLLPSVKRLIEEGSVCTTKRRKQESDAEAQESNKRGIQDGADKHLQPEPMDKSSTSVSDRSFQREPLDHKVQAAQTGTSSQKPNVSCVSPAFKKPFGKVEGDPRGAGRKRPPLQDLNLSCCQHIAKDDPKKHTVEPTWSIDPALTLSTYDTEWRRDEEEQPHHGELVDTDCTWVSHSLLQGRGENDQDRGDGASGEYSPQFSGLGQKANDSLDMMFDMTAYGEYKSYNSSGLGQSHACEEEEEEEYDGKLVEKDPPENSAGQRKAQHPTFAHVAVVRKKDERRKLKGTTCKECETYYAHLPEEEKQKKLSACSRHRFLYIPPNTPENFWEVGFPSTQTCIMRGYIKEEKNPQARLRRRQPFSALFPTKNSQQES